MRQLVCGERQLDLSNTQVMGILNVTPDSFSDGGQLYTGSTLLLDQVLRRAENMLRDGASILDIGGESTRPGAAVVGLQEEMDRVLPVVERIAKELDVVISVDTSSPEVMTEAAAVGAGLLNDVRALGREGAIKAASATGLPICLMHMQGSPATMQDRPSYDDVLDDVEDFLAQRVKDCEAAGIDSDRLILDPGFGFGKTVEHNLRLMNNITHLRNMGFPVLIGTSRKSMIGAVLGRDVDQRLAGSLATVAMAVMQGAEIIRVHDVVETMDVVKMTRAMMRESVEG
ncbi:dihydropteroate synthase [Neptuniibacter caesariensis]|uniref:Dihydropteroate synthase n=1 Tax=Neptuniibacter caesariensis TaxID=207954 RepID=A0A7U8C4I8_NEPCE|nr:dihydropteroate synthase [Neptuniibacter caesariensis]EAR59766.1 dihydropteroate synthase [Oceanospirillum sp. MED92] [Neptuniibacter caesariensis]